MTTTPKATTGYVIKVGDFYLGNSGLVLGVGLATRFASREDAGRALATLSRKDWRRARVLPVMPASRPLF